MSSTSNSSPTPPTELVDKIADPISVEECITCFTGCKLDNIASKSDKLIETLEQLQKDVLRVINILPKQSFVPVVQERIATVRRSLCGHACELGVGGHNNGPTTAVNNWKCHRNPNVFHRIRHVFPFGFYRQNPISRKKVYKVMKKTCG